MESEIDVADDGGKRKGNVHPSWDKDEKFRVVLIKRQCDSGDGKNHKTARCQKCTNELKKEQTLSRPIDHKFVASLLLKLWVSAYENC